MQGGSTGIVYGGLKYQVQIQFKREEEEGEEEILKPLDSIRYFLCKFCRRDALLM